jgi:hypothetical protein
MPPDESFWNIPQVQMRTPLSILREQAELLTKQTDGLMKGEVLMAGDNNQLRIQLAIVVPALRNYKYSIFIYAQPVTIYPGEMFLSDNIIKIPNEGAFVDNLKKILSSPNVTNAIGGLIAQAREAPSEIPS